MLRRDLFFSTTVSEHWVVEIIELLLHLFHLLEVILRSVPQAFP